MFSHNDQVQVMQIQCMLKVTPAMGVKSNVYDHLFYLAIKLSNERPNKFNKLKMPRERRNIPPQHQYHRVLDYGMTTSVLGHTDPILNTNCISEGGNTIISIRLFPLYLWN